MPSWRTRFAEASAGWNVRFFLRIAAIVVALPGAVLAGVAINTLTEDIYYQVYLLSPGLVFPWPLLFVRVAMLIRSSASLIFLDWRFDLLECR
jgi:hypothetical protein